MLSSSALYGADKAPKHKDLGLRAAGFNINVQLALSVQKGSFPHLA